MNEELIEVKVAFQSRSGGSEKIAYISSCNGLIRVKIGDWINLSMPTSNIVFMYEYYCVDVAYEYIILLMNEQRAFTLIDHENLLKIADKIFYVATHSKQGD